MTAGVKKRLPPILFRRTFPKQAEFARINNYIWKFSRGCGIIYFINFKTEMFFMHDELTAKDIEKMQEELDHRRIELRPQLIEEVKRAREYGDLSENFEYKEAKRAKNRNDSRIRYLQAMIKTAVVIESKSEEGVVGLYDRVTVYIPEDDAEESYQIVTGVRYDVSSGFVSKESPFGKAVLGKRVGDTATVSVNENYSYDVIVRSIEKMDDDDSAPLASY